MYYCICYYLAELLALHLVIYVYRRTYKNYLQVLTVFYQIKKIIFGRAGALGPGLAGLCLKTALLAAPGRAKDASFIINSCKPCDDLYSANESYLFNLTSG